MAVPLLAEGDPTSTAFEVGLHLSLSWSLETNLWAVPYENNLSLCSLNSRHTNLLNMKILVFKLLPEIFLLIIIFTATCTVHIESTPSKSSTTNLTDRLSSFHFLAYVPAHAQVLPLGQSHGVPQQHGVLDQLFASCHRTHLSVPCTGQFGSPAGSMSSSYGGAQHQSPWRVCIHWPQTPKDQRLKSIIKEISTESV